MPSRGVAIFIQSILTHSRLIDRHWVYLRDVIVASIWVIAIYDIENRSLFIFVFDEEWVREIVGEQPAVGSTSLFSNHGRCGRAVVIGSSHLVFDGWFPFIRFSLHVSTTTTTTSINILNNGCWCVWKFCISEKRNQVLRKCGKRDDITWDNQKNWSPMHDFIEMVTSGDMITVYKKINADLILEKINSKRDRISQWII